MASLRDLTPKVAKLAQVFVAVLESAEFAALAGVRGRVNVVVTSTRRSLDTQARLFNDYLAGRSRYPAAPPGQSPHALGIAFDLHLDPPVYELAGALWEALGLRWGGRFNDPIHFDTRPVGWQSTRPLTAAERRAKARLPKNA